MRCTSTCCALEEGQQTQVEICQCTSMQNDLASDYGVAPSCVLTGRALCHRATMHI